MGESANIPESLKQIIDSFGVAMEIVDYPQAAPGHKMTEKRYAFVAGRMGLNGVRPPYVDRKEIEILTNAMLDYNLTNRYGEME